MREVASEWAYLALCHFLDFLCFVFAFCQNFRLGGTRPPGADGTEIECHDFAWLSQPSGLYYSDGPESEAQQGIPSATGAKIIMTTALG